jgi:hypothetical protein
MGSTLEDRASARPRAQPAMGSGAVASSATQRATQTSPTTATHALESLPAVPRSSKLRSKCRRPRLRISLQIPATEFTNPTGCNRWQPVANSDADKTAKSSERRCHRLPPVARDVRWVRSGAPGESIADTVVRERSARRQVSTQRSRSYWVFTRTLATWLPTTMARCLSRSPCAFASRRLSGESRRARHRLRRRVPMRSSR